MKHNKKQLKSTKTTKNNYKRPQQLKHPSAFQNKQNNKNTYKQLTQPKQQTNKQRN